MCSLIIHLCGFAYNYATLPIRQLGSHVRGMLSAAAIGPADVLIKGVSLMRAPFKM